MLIHRASGRLAAEGEGGSRPPVAPRTLLHKRLARAGPQLRTHSLINAALLCIARHQPTTNARTKNTSRPTRVDRLESITCPSLCPWEPRLHTLTPAHSPSSTPTCCTSLPCEMEDSLLLNICSRMPCRPRPEALAASAPSHCGHPHSCHCQPPSLEALLAVEGGQRAARAPFRSPHHLIHKGCGGPTPHATATTLTHLPPLLPPPNTNVQAEATQASERTITLSPHESSSTLSHTSKLPLTLT